jgi:predicted nucleic acid-binding protein
MLKGLPVTGTLGVLLAAKDQGILPKVRDVLDALRAAGFRVSDALIQEILRRAGE